MFLRQIRLKFGVRFNLLPCGSSISLSSGSWWLMILKIVDSLLLRRFLSSFVLPSSKSIPKLSNTSTAEQEHHQPSPVRPLLLSSSTSCSRRCTQDPSVVSIRSIDPTSQWVPVDQDVRMTLVVVPEESSAIGRVCGHDASKATLSFRTCWIVSGLRGLSLSPAGNVCRRAARVWV